MDIPEAERHATWKIEDAIGRVLNKDTMNRRLHMSPMRFDTWRKQNRHN